jgi:aryl-alcohol dehydrogenase-like predicted oxidoreductase
LSGKYDESTTFAAEDHRTFNRLGQAFDVGETFSGVPFEIGVSAARRVAALAKGSTTAQLALRWILDQPGVSTIIPGARNASQVTGNAAAAGLRPLSAEVLDALRDIYDDEIREQVQDRW